MPVMKKLVPFIAASMLAWAAFAQDDAAAEDQASPCEQACIDSEEACYERCPSTEEYDACADDCYSVADACLNRCSE
jgi:hypothetical protein